MCPFGKCDYLRHPLRPPPLYISGSAPSKSFAFMGERTDYQIGWNQQPIVLALVNRMFAKTPLVRALPFITASASKSTAFKSCLKTFLPPSYPSSFNNWYPLMPVHRDNKTTWIFYRKQAFPGTSSSHRFSYSVAPKWRT